MARLVAVALVAFVMVRKMESYSVAGAAQVASGSSCAGLAAYRGDMMSAGRQWVKGMRSDGLLGRSTRSYDETEWAAYAARAKQLMIDLREVEPPAFAAPWHEAQIETARLRFNFAGWTTLLGFDVTAESFASRVAKVMDDVAAGRESASASCARFEKLAGEWDHLDGHDTSGPDESKPTSIEA